MQLKYSFLSVILFFASFTFGQNQIPAIGGGEYSINAHDEITDVERLEIKNKLQENIEL